MAQQEVINQKAAAAELDRNPSAPAAANTAVPPAAGGANEFVYMGPGRTSGALPAADVGGGRQTAQGRRAWLTRLRFDLLAKVHAIAEVCREIAAEPEHSPEPIVSGANDITAVCGLLEETLEQRLSSKAFESPESPFEDSTFGRVRHDLINASLGISYLCDELIQEDAQRFSPLAESLAEIKSLYQELLNKIRYACRLEPMAGTGGQNAKMDTPRPPLPEESRGVILIVDDDEMSRKRLITLLSSQGHAVTAAENGHEALQQLGKQNFDLVLLDIHMDKMDGHELLDKIQRRNNWKKIPVVMVSATGDVENIAQCIENGAADYLPKPIEPRLLEARVNYCLGRRRAMQKEEKLRADVARERDRANEVLRELFPRHIVGNLLYHRDVAPRWQPNVAVMFSDVVGFTKYCYNRDPDQIVTKLGILFESFEEIADRYHVDKIKTIGDCFMGTSGLFDYAGTNPVLDCLKCAIEMHVAARERCEWNLRVGINFGPAVVGVVGKKRYAFDLWGDTVNTASRVQTNAEAGHTFLSADAWRQVENLASADELDAVAVKNRGEMVFYRFVELLQD